MKNAAKVWTPNYPRNCASNNGEIWGQVTVYGLRELLHNLKNVNGTCPGYVSTYSFPDGHPTDNSGNLPKFDTLMIDFDFDFNKEEFDYSEWKRKLGDLLTRIRMVSKELVDQGFDKYWRASLSGYKGVHLYLDFPPLDKDLGTPKQYKNGMDSFTQGIINGLKNESGIDDLEDYIDVSSGWDFSRLTRLPNTIHEKATKQFNETRYCVPVSIEELKNIGIKEYVALTKSKREVPEKCERFPNLSTKKKAEKEIKTATKTVREEHSPSIKSEELFDNYVDDVVNENVTLDDVRFLLKRKPCIWEFSQNPDKFNQGNSSHIMEMQCIMAMQSIGAPLDVMHEFFEEHPNREIHPQYDQEETSKRIKEVLSRDYQEFNCSTVLEDAPQFCLKQGCKTYLGNKDLQSIH